MGSVQVWNKQIMFFFFFFFFLQLADKPILKQWSPKSKTETVQHQTFLSAVRQLWRDQFDF